MSLRQFLYSTHDIDACPAFPNGHQLSRACVNVTLCYGSHCTDTYTALIDTGSDYCVFPPSALASLSIPESDLRYYPAKGYGGDLGLQFARVKIKLEDFGEWEAWVGFADHECVCALGNHEFLDVFKITLHPQKQYFEIESTEQTLK